MGEKKSEDKTDGASYERHRPKYNLNTVCGCDQGG